MSEQNKVSSLRENGLSGRWRLLLLGAAGLLMSGACSPVRAEAPATEVQQRLLDDLKVLASDELEGRGIGTKGLNFAAERIQARFQEAGLKLVAAGGDPFQEFEVVNGATLGKVNSLKFIGPEGETISFEYGVDVQTCSFGESGKFAQGVVFCGYGIESKEPEYDDFAGVDVKGKIVIVMRRTPQQDQEHGLFAAGHGGSRHGSLKSKISNAYQRGAAAVLFVNDPFSGKQVRDQIVEQLQQAKTDVIAKAEKLVSEDPANRDGVIKEIAEQLTRLHQTEGVLADYREDPLMEFGYAGTKTGKSLPILHISQAKCNELLAVAAKTSLAELEATIDRTGKPHSMSLDGWKAEGETSVVLSEVEIANVVGVLEGEGPLANETLVIGAHYDHIGMGEDGSLTPGVREVHNGADDNASGTSALIEVARRLASRKEKPARRIVFIAFTGEERGLLGSAYYVKNPIFPLEHTVAMLNMDMVGRLEDEKLTIFGTGTSPRWKEILPPIVEREKFLVTMKPEGFGPSDHASFYAKKIPVLHLFTGTHNDYHRPSDDWEKVNLNGMERIVNLLETVAWSVANQPERPEYIAIQERATLTRSGNRPYFGSIPDFSNDAEGYAIQGVAPGSPAEKGGIQGGDVLIRLGEHAIGSLDDFDLALRKYAAGQEVTMTVRRGNEEIKLRVVLGAPRS